MARPGPGDSPLQGEISGQIPGILEQDWGCGQTWGYPVHDTARSCGLVGVSPGGALKGIKLGPVHQVEVRRSTRRKKSVQAYREGNKTVVMVPAHFTKSQEEQVVAEMLAKLDRSERKRKAGIDLMARSSHLNQRFLNRQAIPVQVSWVSNQNTRWGSCTSSDRTIRVSDRMIGMPLWVIDYVLLHELAHLIEPNHSPRFHALVNQFPDAARAQAFLDGYSFGR